jgi:transcriptional regulator with XRE-family HTH domain
MKIGQRLRVLRERKGLSQNEMERRSGLVRTYISRIEQGHTVPSLETLEKYAAALGIPLYRVFYSRDDTPATPRLTPRRSLEELAAETGPSGSDARFLLKVRDLAVKMLEPDRAFLLDFARKLVTR